VKFFYFHCNFQPH